MNESGLSISGFWQCLSSALKPLSYERWETGIPILHKCQLFNRCSQIWFLRYLSLHPENVRVSTSPGRKILTNKERWASCVWNQASSGSLANHRTLSFFILFKYPKTNAPFFLKVWTQYSCSVRWMCQVGMCQQCSVEAPDTLILTANRELCEQAWAGV